MRQGAARRMQIQTCAMSKDPETMQEFEKVKRLYGEKFDEKIAIRTEKYRKAEKKLKDFRVTF